MFVDRKGVEDIFVLLAKPSVQERWGGPGLRDSLAARL